MGLEKRMFSTIVWDGGSISDIKTYRKQNPDISPHEQHSHLKRKEHNISVPTDVDKKELDSELQHTMAEEMAVLLIRKLWYATVGQSPW